MIDDILSLTKIVYNPNSLWITPKDVIKMQKTIAIEIQNGFHQLNGN